MNTSSDEDNVMVDLNDHSRGRPTNSSRSPVVPHIDQRGKHDKYKHKLSDAQLNFICRHIGIFPRYVSYYTRKENPNKRYPKSASSVAEMYRLYKI